MIDTCGNVTFYDNRSRDSSVLRMTEVSLQGDAVCLCRATDEGDPIKLPSLFFKTTN